MVLIVNTTSDNELSKEFREILEERNTEYEMIEAADMNISPCLGCNFCWLKTPVPMAHLPYRDRRDGERLIRCTYPSGRIRGDQRYSYRG